MKFRNKNLLFMLICLIISIFSVWCILTSELSLLFVLYIFNAICYFVYAMFFSSHISSDGVYNDFENQN